MIQLINISKIYGGKKRKMVALSDVSLTFPETGLYLIEGKSGAGKSTLLKLISLQDKPTSGKIMIDGKDTSELSQKDILSYRANHFAFVSQDSNLMNSFNIKENLEAAVDIQNRQIESISLEKALADVSLSETFLYRKPSEISGGERQRVTIARALLRESKVLICDEPTGSLDEENAVTIMELLKEVSNDKLVILVSHNGGLSKKYADYSVRISDGKVIESHDQNIPNGDIKTNQPPKSGHFSFSRSLRFSMSFLRKSIGKFILSLVSCFLGLSVALTATSMASLSDSEIIKDGFLNTNDELMLISKYEDQSHQKFKNLSKSDLSAAKETFEEQNVTSHYFGKFAVSLNDKSPAGYSFLQYTHTSYLDEELANNAKYKIYGAYPSDVWTEDTTGTMELMITAHECYTHGWISSEDGLNETNASEILTNISINIICGKLHTGDEANVYKAKIVGIIDTGYPDTSNMPDNWIQSRIDGELHNAIFISSPNFETFSWYDRDGAKTDEQDYGTICVFNGSKNYFKLDQFKDKADQDCEFSIGFRYIQTVEYLRTFKVAMGGYISVAMAVFLLIAFFSMASFLKTAIDRSAEDTRILQLMGLPKWNLCFIYVLEALGAILLTLLLALIPYFIAMHFINAYAKSYFVLAFYPFSLFPWQLLCYVFLPAIGLSVLLATIMALWRNHKNVKDANNVTD